MTAQATGLSVQEVRDDDYTQDKYAEGRPKPGYLLAWLGRPVQDFYVPLDPQLRLGQHGYVEVTEAELAKAGLRRRLQQGAAESRESSGAGSERSSRRGPATVTQGQEADPVVRTAVEKHAEGAAERFFTRRAGP
jgi:hypothetical protein